MNIHSCSHGYSLVMIYNYIAANIIDLFFCEKVKQIIFYYLLLCKYKALSLKLFKFYGFMCLAEELYRNRMVVETNEEISRRRTTRSMV